MNRGVTTHGFAINVNNDLQPFEWIVPCGIEDCRMTSVAQELDGQLDMERFMDIVSREVGVLRRELPVRQDTLTDWPARTAAMTERTPPARDPLACEPGRPARPDEEVVRSARASRRG